MMEWLSETVAPLNKEFLYAKNRVLRKAWYTMKLGLDRYLDAADDVSNFPLEVAKYSRSRDILRKVIMSTGSGS